MDIIADIERDHPGLAHVMHLGRRGRAAGGGRHPAGTGGRVSDLHLVPVSQRHAKAFCAMWHRHHAPPRGMKFAVGAATGDGVLHAIATAGRPVARLYDDGVTLEVTRVASDGHRNSCSMLYGACARAGFALGYTRIITYTQAGESGASLRAAGWRVIAERPAHPGWDRPSRPRELHGTENIPRTLWEAA